MNSNNSFLSKNLTSCSKFILSPFYCNLLKRIYAIKNKKWQRLSRFAGTRLSKMLRTFDHCHAFIFPVKQLLLLFAGTINFSETVERRLSIEIFSVRLLSKAELTLNRYILDRYLRFPRWWQWKMDLTYYLWRSFGYRNIWYFVS